MVQKGFVFLSQCCSICPTICSLNPHLPLIQEVDFICDHGYGRMHRDVIGVFFFFVTIGWIMKSVKELENSGIALNLAKLIKDLYLADHNAHLIRLNEVM